MRPNLTLVTLGVSDFDRSLAFYKDGLKWPTKAKPGDPVAFFKLNGIALGLFPREELAKDAHVPDDGTGFRAISLAFNARSEEEVDDVMKEAEGIGATIIKPAEKVFWGGYSGYFADPDGFLWEVAYNPFWTLDNQGIVTEL